MFHNFQRRFSSSVARATAGSAAPYKMAASVGFAGLATGGAYYSYSNYSTAPVPSGASGSSSGALSSTKTLAAAATGATAAAGHGKTAYAICIMNPDGGSGVNGLVKMVHTEGQLCKITAHITGLTPGVHGFHVHEFGNLTKGCVTAGPHYNPFSKTHGCPGREERHVGDMGNVTAGADGVATFELEDELVSLWGEHNVIGRSCVVHADVDDLGDGGHELSKTTGNAGARLACGVIGLSGAFE